jgi:hypothetical protein
LSALKELLGRETKRALRAFVNVQDKHERIQAKILVLPLCFFFLHSFYFQVVAILVFVRLQSVYNLAEQKQQTESSKFRVFSF